METTAMMMDLECNKSMEESSTESGDESSGTSVSPKSDYIPKDLTLKPTLKRPKPIPPPLNLRHDHDDDQDDHHPPDPSPLSACLKEFAIIATSSQSPLVQVQKNLPFRKRAHSVPDGAENGPMSAPPVVFKYFPSLFPFKQETSLDEDSNPPLNLSLPPTPKGFQDRDSESPQSASAVVSSSHTEVASPQISSSSHPTSPQPPMTEARHFNIGSGPVARHHIPPWSPYLPTPPHMASHWLNGASSALLSPAPSSLGSSQEDLRHGATSLPLSSVPSLVYESNPWRLPWPYPVWHCFQLGTILHFSFDNSDVTLRAEDVHQSGELQFLTPERFGPLRVKNITPSDTHSGFADVTFSCVTPGIASNVKVLASCYLYHTFLVMEKGWCAVSPELVLRQYGIQCQPLECGDVCAVPPKMPSVSSPGICDKFKRFSFSPDELGSSQPPSSSSMLLSPPNTPTMKSQQQSQRPQSSSTQASKGSKSKQKPSSGQTTDKASKPSKAPLDPDRPKRPMNAFMLFAKQHRLKLIRMHPGKDNRFVSVILGEAWRQLPADQKEVFIAEARALSHERKRLHPECWKRKRTQSSNTVGVKVAPSNE